MKTVAKNGCTIVGPRSRWRAKIGWWQALTLTLGGGRGKVAPAQECPGPSKTNSRLTRGRQLWESGRLCLT